MREKPYRPLEGRKITDMSKQEAEGASFIPVRYEPDDDLPTDEEIVKSLIPKWPPNC